MAEVSQRCSICEERGIYKNAINWCSECDEKLCVECTEHHSSSKLTKQHETRTIEEFLMLPSFILEVKHFCEEHDEKFQIFCKTHDCPGCRRCGLEKHKNCRDIVPLEDIISNVKTSVSFQDIQQQLKEIAGNISKISKDRQESMTSIAQQRQQIEKDISSVRRKINDHLDNLQQKLIDELSEAEVQSNLQIQNILTKLHEKGDEIKELQSNMVNIQKYASDLQAFLSVKQIGASTMSCENFLQSLVQDKKIKRTFISCKLDDIVLNFSTCMSKFGEIKIDAQPCKIEIGIDKLKQAQIMVPKTLVLSVENISVQMMKKFKPGCNNVRGCCLLPDGKMVLAPWDAGKIYILNKDGSLDFTIKFQRPCDVAYIDDETLAVSSATFSDFVSIVSLKKKIAEKKIKVGCPVYGVTHNDGDLFCCSRDKGLLRISLKDASVVSIGCSSSLDWSYLTTYNNNIYYTGEDTVICCDMGGNIKWRLNSEFSRKLYGITVDNAGRIFAVGSSTVWVVSPDGKQYKAIITNLDQPQVLHCARPSNTLLIATRKDNHFLYNYIV